MKYAKIIACRILISKKGMVLWDNSRQIEVRIFKIGQKLSEQEQERRCPFIFGRILTRIVSRFQIYIQNWNPTSAVRLASFSKYVTKNWLLFEQFSSDFNNSHFNLTRIVSQIHSFFRNKNRTNVARTATIFSVHHRISAPNSVRRMTPALSFVFSLNYISLKN